MWKSAARCWRALRRALEGRADVAGGRAGPAWDAGPTGSGDRRRLVWPRQLVASRITRKPLTGPTFAGAPARCLVAARRAAQEHTIAFERQQRVVAVQPAHGAVKVPQCPRQQPRRSDRVRCRRNRPRNEVFDVDRHDLNVSFSDCHLLDAV